MGLDLCGSGVFSDSVHNVASRGPQSSRYNQLSCRNDFLLHCLCLFPLLLVLSSLEEVHGHCVAGRRVVTGGCRAVLELSADM